MRKAPMVLYKYNYSTWERYIKIHCQSAWERYKNTPCQRFDALETNFHSSVCNPHMMRKVPMLLYKYKPKRNLALYKFYQHLDVLYKSTVTVPVCAQ
eukprot:7922978-Ditylum_brightwellii.AAC.1